MTFFLVLIFRLYAYTPTSPFLALCFIPFLFKKNVVQLCRPWEGEGRKPNSLTRADLTRHFWRPCLHCLLWSPINGNICALPSSGLLQQQPLPYPSPPGGWQNDGHTKSFCIVVEISHPNGFFYGYTDSSPAVSLLSEGFHVPLCLVGATCAHIPVQ